jgi:hypothetical protein
MNAITTAHIFAAEVMGTAAFNEGKKSAPAADRVFMNYLAELTAEGVVGEVGSSLPLLKAWNRAWHAQNINMGLQMLAKQ